MRNCFLTLALLTLVACGGEESSEQHLARAKDYINASDYPSAAIELKNALKLDDASAEARWLLGKVYLETGEMLAAESALRRAQDMGWKADDVRPALAKTLLVQGKVADVLALDYQDLNPTAAALLLSSQAMAALSDKQTDKAAELVALALGKAPQLPEAKLAQATIAIQQGDATAALSLVDAIMVEAPDNEQARWLKGQALLQQGKLEDARAAFDQSIANSETAFAERIARALVSLQLKDYETAQADATELLKLSPQDPTANYIQGAIHFQNKQYRQAITALTLAEPVAQQFPLVLYYRSSAYLNEKDLDLAEKFGSQFVTLHPDDGNGRKMLAAILLLQHKVKDAQDMLQPVLDQNPDDLQALNFMANALLLDDHADIGMLLYAQIVLLEPTWLFVPLPEKAPQMRSGSGEQASQPLEAVPDAAANFPQTDILSILNHLTSKDFPGAIEVAKSYQFADPQSLSPYRVLGRVYFAAGQLTEAKDAFEKVLKRDPGDPTANLGLAEMSLAEGSPDKANHYYQTVLRAHPNDLTTLMQLVAVEASKNNVTAMVARLNQAIQAHPTAFEPRVRLASYYMGVGNPERVEPLLAKLTGLQRRSPRVLELTALAQRAQNQNEAALATAQQLVDANPASAPAHYLLALAASATGDQQKAKQALLEAIKHDPKHLLALLALAEIAKSEGQRAQLEQYVATLVELAPDAPDVLRLRALLAQANGNVAEALVLSQRAFKQAPTTQIVLELTAYQKAAGRAEAARNTLQQWIKNHPQDIAVRLLLAKDLALDNDRAGAQAQYGAVLAQEPDNIIALNNLAWDLRLDNPAQALAYIRKASNLAPDQPDLLDTLAVIESLNGDHKGAQETIQRALAARPDDVTMRFHQAMIAAALGDKTQAIAALEELLHKDVGEFPERAEAEALLKALKG